MAIGIGSIIEISLNMLYLSQQMAMVFQYEVDTNPTPATGVEWAAAWWDEVKGVTRPLAHSALGDVFRTVKLRMPNAPTGDYGTFDIPGAEQAGTRSGSIGDAMPPYVAVGVQLVVGTRVTRPGQKRVPFVYEGDSDKGVLLSGLEALIDTWATLISADMTLAAPAAGNIIIPVVCSKDGSGAVVAHQPVTGYLINPYVTTQNSRKYGRGI